MGEFRDYPRIPVRLPSWEELNRRSADGINFILNNLADDEDEAADILVATDPTDYDPATGRITNWTADIQPPDSIIEWDPITGQATVHREGIYFLLANVYWSGTGNNQWYGIEGRANGSFFTFLGGVLWSNQFPGGALASAGGTGYSYLNEGDVVDIAWHPAGLQIAPDGGQFSIRWVAAT